MIELPLVHVAFSSDVVLLDKPAVLGIESAIVMATVMISSVIVCLLMLRQLPCQSTERCNPHRLRYLSRTDVFSVLVSREYNDLLGNRRLAVHDS